MMLRVAAMFDRAERDEREAGLRRIATPIAKYWVTKRTTAVVREAMECLGGNGYVEESPLPRWFRESPLNAIWEGSGNVIALDLLRAIRSRRVRVHEVETASASPFARSLVFAYVAAYIYEQDSPLAERKAQALTLDRNLLNELLGQAELRELIDPEVLEQLERELQELKGGLKGEQPETE